MGFGCGSYLFSSHALVSNVVAVYVSAFRIRVDDGDPRTVNGQTLASRKNYKDDLPKQLGGQRVCTARTLPIASSRKIFLNCIVTISAREAYRDFSSRLGYPCQLTIPRIGEPASPGGKYPKPNDKLMINFCRSLRDAPASTR